MLTRVNRAIEKRLEKFIENKYPLICRMVAEAVLEPYRMEMSERLYQILGEYLMFRLAEHCEHTKDFAKNIITAKGNRGRDLVEAFMKVWLQHAMGLAELQRTFPERKALTRHFEEIKFVRTPDPAPLTKEQEEMLDKDLEGWK